MDPGRPEGRRRPAGAPCGAPFQTTPSESALRVRQGVHRKSIKCRRQSLDLHMAGGDIAAGVEPERSPSGRLERTGGWLFEERGPLDRTKSAPGAAPGTVSGAFGALARQGEPRGARAVALIACPLASKTLAVHDADYGSTIRSRRAGEPESRRAGEPESRRASPAGPAGLLDTPARGRAGSPASPPLPFPFWLPRPRPGAIRARAGVRPRAATAPAPRRASARRWRRPNGSADASPQQPQRRRRGRHARFIPADHESTADAPPRRAGHARGACRGCAAQTPASASRPAPAHRTAAGRSSNPSQWSTES